jgi:hypothetical protein
MTKVLGIDIGAKFVMAFSLDKLPTGIAYKDYYYQHTKRSLHKIRLDNKSKKFDGDGIDLQKAIDLLKELSPDAIVMEPTGVWYSKLWLNIATHLGIEVKWIGHADLAYQRGHYDFNDKDDETDAFCLALTYFDPVFNASNRWLTWRTGTIAATNDRFLELKSLESSTKVLEQQLRQRLKSEFPEVADRTIGNNKNQHGYLPWIGFLANIHTYRRIERERDNSIATQLGIEISQYTRDHALAICCAHQREMKLKAELETLLADPIFDRYNPILEQFGFGIMLKPIILSCIYPFEKYLLDGQPYIKRWEDRSGWHKKNRSLAGFQISLGMGKRKSQSGQSTDLIYSGSGMARKQLYTWIMGNVLPQKFARALSNKDQVLTVAELRKRWKSTQGSNADRHKAGARSAMTLGYRITRLLYEELLAEFHVN